MELWIWCKQRSGNNAKPTICLFSVYGWKFLEKRRHGQRWNIRNEEFYVANDVNVSHFMSHFVRSPAYCVNLHAEGPEQAALEVLQHQPRAHGGGSRRYTQMTNELWNWLDLTPNQTFSQNKTHMTGLECWTEFENIFFCGTDAIKTVSVPVQNFSTLFQTVSISNLVQLNI